MSKDPDNTIGIATDEELASYCESKSQDALMQMYEKTGIRSEEIWQIMWIAGLIEDGDFYGGYQNYATLMRALTKANALKAARDAA